MEAQTEYPSWKDALFSGDKIANLRCAVKYVVWQASYVLLTLVTLLVAGLFRVGEALAGVVPVNTLDPVFRRIGSGASSINGFLESSGAKKAARIGSGVLIGLCALMSIGVLIWMAIMEPVAFGVSLGLIVISAIIAIGATYIKEETTLIETAKGTASSAASKAAETPGVRRVYGNCPVHMDLEPKWYENLSGKE